MPDVDLGTLDRLAIPVAETGIDEQCRPRRRRADDRAAVRRDRRAHAPEWPEQARVRVGLTVGIIEQAHERRNAKRTRDQHRLVMRFVARLAESNDVIESRAKLFLGQLRVTHEVVHVADEGAHDLLEARVWGTLQFLQDGRRDVFLALDDHQVAFFFIGSFTASTLSNSTLNSSPFTFSTLRM